MLIKVVLSNLIVLSFASLALANKGTYTVPTDSPVATTELQNFNVIKDNFGNKSIQFTLSEDLIGPSKVPSTLMLVSTTISTEVNLFKFKDPKGGPAWALCESRVTEMSCTVDYEELTYDQNLRDNFLKDKFKADPELLAEKLNVATTFGTDPGGFLKVTCNTDHCGLLD